jgi:hypothetical protein
MLLQPLIQEKWSQSHFFAKASKHLPHARVQSQFGRARDRSGAHVIGATGTSAHLNQRLNLCSLTSLNSALASLYSALHVLQIV